MSQLDEAILDALTHVTFPKGFAQAEPAWVVTVDGVDYPLWKTDAPGSRQWCSRATCSCGT